MVAALKATKEPYVMQNMSGFIFDTLSDLGTEVIPYGSTSLLEYAKRQRWRHVFHNDNFNVDVYNKYHRTLNYGSLTMTLSDAKRVLCSPHSSIRGPWFIRPVDDTKAFAGHVITQVELRDWVTILEDNDCEVTPNTVVSLSCEKDIDMEWRYFIVGGKIISGSAYRFKGASYTERETEQDVIEEAQAIADLWLPHPCCVMDLALWEGKPCVVEFNGLNSSGFYDHDVTAIVRAVSEYVKESQ